MEDETGQFLLRKQHRSLPLRVRYINAMSYQRVGKERSMERQGSSSPAAAAAAMSNNVTVGL